MKSLHVIDSLGRGGAEQILAVLLPELRRQGQYVTLAVLGGAMDLAPEIESEGILVHKMRPRHRWNLFGLAREVARLIQREDVHLVHAHLYFPAVVVALMRVLGLSTVRTCVTFHNLAYDGANRKTFRLYMRQRLASWLYPRGIDRCFAVSTAVSESYRAALGLSRIDVLSNPIDLSAIRNITAGQATSTAVGSECRIVLPGRLVQEKGHADLVEAVAILSLRKLNPKIVFVGDGPLRAEIEGLASKKGISAQVGFTGALPHSELMAIVAGADIVAIPSRFEGFGLTALEALALGRAVVASSAGGLPETIGEAGVLISVANPLALATAIADLAADPARRAALGAAGVQRAKAFDLPTIAARLIAEYETLCDPHSAGSKN